MDNIIHSIITKDYIAAEKQFQKEIFEKVNIAINDIKYKVSKSILESTKRPMEEQDDDSDDDDNDNGIDDEEEMIDEISKNTLGSYVKKAKDSYASKTVDVYKGEDSKSYPSQRKRGKFIDKAVDKLADEKE